MGTNFGDAEMLSITDSVVEPGLGVELMAIDEVEPMFVDDCAAFAYYVAITQNQEKELDADKEAEVRRRQLRFLGHVQRMDAHRLPKQILYGELEEGSRTRGRPITSWRNNAQESIKLFGINEKDWQELAESKSEWEEYIKGFGMDNFLQEWEKNRETLYQKRKAKEREVLLESSS